MRLRRAAARCDSILRAVVGTWLLLGLWSAPTPGLAADAIQGLDAPETIRLEDRELTRNGVGVRSATRFFLTADIYVAALYVAEPSSDADRILASDEPKELRMRYLYAIGAEDMKRAWRYSFDENCPERDCGAYEAAVEQFMERVLAVSPGDAYRYRFFRDRTEIEQPGREPFTVRGAAFARLLLSTWIGRAPPTEELKAALLAARAATTPR